MFTASPVYERVGRVDGALKIRHARLRGRAPPVSVATHCRLEQGPTMADTVNWPALVADLRRLLSDLHPESRRAVIARAEVFHRVESPHRVVVLPRRHLSSGGEFRPA